MDSASTVTVQVSLLAKSLSGLSVKVVGPVTSGAACAPLVVQLMENQLSTVLTGSLKVMMMSASTATLVAPSAGVVELTLGAASAGGTGASATPRKAVFVAAVAMEAGEAVMVAL